ncbi:MAG: sigma-70 family RNA polymerase sigma factor [Bacilli bacterium]|nr:sigma-70 family RNA polymerase sigma factor [Bacilli bacterium]
MEKIGYSILKKLCSTSVNEMNEAFNIVFDKYRYLVYYVSYDILKSEEEAKDIVNETFLKMYENRGNFDNESKLKYFLLVTAKNLSINRYNQNKDHLAYSDNIEGKADSDNLSIYLENFKEVLDEEEYQYLVLHLIYGFKFKEIAIANNLTTSQVSSKYQRGIYKLRDFYGGSFNE